MTPYQTFGWVSAFAATVGTALRLDIRHAVLRDAAGVVVAILPLTITRHRGLRVAQFIGGKHANYHMGLYERAFAATMDAAGGRGILTAIAAAIGRLDAFAFVNQPSAWRGGRNPLAALATGESPSGAYKLALAPGDCDGTLRRAMSAHARKKMTNKRNRLALLGEVRTVRAQTAAEVDRILEAFLSQKAQRFAAMGLQDPFAEPGMRDFLRRAALGDDTHPPAVELHALKRDGDYVATYVGAVHGGRFSGMATSFDMLDEAARMSPGELLLLDLIKLKCQDGFDSLDLGVGEARYKSAICDDKDDLFDTFLPLTAAGHVLVRFRGALQRAKRWIKSHPRAEKLARSISARLSRRQRSSGED